MPDPATRSAGEGASPSAAARTFLGQTPGATPDGRDSEIAKGTPF